MKLSWKMRLAWNMRINGYRLREIAARIGHSHQYASQLVKAYPRARVRDLEMQMKALQDQIALCNKKKAALLLVTGAIRELIALEE